MDIIEQHVSLHPQLLNQLFAYKSKTRAVFNDVLGLHEINHISITYISPSNRLIALSSTPSIEFNLFSSPLWQYDKTFSLNWFKQCSQASWQSLYSPERYDELYYIKQTKPHYPFGYSMAAKLRHGHVIYSFASKSKADYPKQLIQDKPDEFYKLGQYCTTQLLPLLINDEETLASLLHPQLTGAL